MRKVIKRRKVSLIERIVKWLFNKKLLKNKLCSIALMLVGYFTIGLEGDCTAFVFTLLLGLPIFFANENVIG